MIQYPDKQQLVDLINREHGRCVTILMPTYQSGRETNQNSIRFKNLLREALEQVGSPDDAVAKQLSELEYLIHDSEFWQHQSDGLAIFVCNDMHQLVQLDHDVDATVYVADHFYTKPLAAAACDQDSCYLLALSWDRARWFRASPHGLQEVVNDAFPATMDELVLERDDEEQLQLTSHRSRGQGSGPADVAMYHGHGEGEEKIEADRDHYLVRVGRLVSDAIYNQNRSLVVMATDEVAGHFKAVAGIDFVDVIQASPENLSDSQIAEKVTQWLDHHNLGNQEQLSERLGAAIANQSGSTNVQDIVLAAMQGRIDTLLLASNEPHWGTINVDEQKVHVTGEPAAGCVDLATVAARGTLLAGGTVHHARQSDSVAAIYRY
ncbi:MAG: hypothetical protein HKN47_02220 [Pirellulaceae bacterium]|nr:hypothetical protein [Pirellulaceae bacterium]